MRLYTSELVKKYKARTVVNHVSIDVNQGEIVGLLGPNGAGKTTTFYMIVGLIKPNAGKIFLENDQKQVSELTELPVYRRAQLGVGYLAQEASVFRRLSVEDNIRAVLEMTSYSKEYQQERVEALIEEFRLQKVRKGGLTFAPEAGTQRLRDAINKNVREEDLLHSCQVAFEGGWNGVKLYFMLGLPTETDEDVVGIAELANQVLHTWRMHATNKARGVRITVSTSCFVPKPHSPFQWETQVTMDEYKRKVQLLRESIRAKSVTYNWHDPDTSFVEAVLSRGDRRIADVIEEVWRRGGKLEAWGDYFSFDRWMAAMAACGVDPMFYACRERGKDAFLQWDIVNMGVRRAHLWHEREQAYKAELSPDCRRQCTGCGALALMTEGGKCDA